MRGILDILIKRERASERKMREMERVHALIVCERYHEVDHDRYQEVDHDRYQKIMEAITREVVIGGETER